MDFFKELIGAKSDQRDLERMLAGVEQKRAQIEELKQTREHNRLKLAEIQAQIAQEAKKRSAAKEKLANKRENLFLVQRRRVRFYNTEKTLGKEIVKFHTAIQNVTMNHITANKASLEQAKDLSKHALTSAQTVTANISGQIKASTDPCADEAKAILGELEDLKEYSFPAISWFCVASQDTEANYNKPNGVRLKEEDPENWQTFVDDKAEMRLREAVQLEAQLRKQLTAETEENNEAQKQIAEAEVEIAELEAQEIASMRDEIVYEKHRAAKFKGFCSQVDELIEKERIRLGLRPDALAQICKNINDEDE